MSGINYEIPVNKTGLTLLIYGFPSFPFLDVDFAGFSVFVSKIYKTNPFKKTKINEKRYA
jgi:hypothetical protein